MADYKSKVDVTFIITVVMSESEARALDALTGYGTDNFLECLYEHLGKHYMQPHEKGLRSLFSSIRDKVPAHLRQVDNARKAFK